MAGTAVGGVVGLLMVAVIGFVIGVVAKLLMPGPDPRGWFVIILLGIAGSWVGGFQFGLLGLGGGLLGFVGTVLGAMLLLGIYRIAKGKKSRWGDCGVLAVGNIANLADVRPEPPAVPHYVAIHYGSVS